MSAAGLRGAHVTRIEARGTTFETRESGAGDPLVLVHGSVSDLRTWEHLRPIFDAHFRTISYSRRHHWPNAPIPEGRDYSMEEQAEDLRAVLDAAAGAPAHVVGHSYGAYLALLVAIRAPELVRSLVLAEPPVIRLFVSDPPTPAELLRTLVRRPRTALAIMRFGALGVAPATKALERGDPEAALRAFGPAVLGRAAFEALSSVRREQVRANLIPAEFLGSGFAPLDETEIRHVSAPTLLVTSRSSPSLFALLADRLEELLPRVDRVVIPDASHIMHEDNPDAYSSAVLRFLRGQPVG